MRKNYWFRRTVGIICIFAWPLSIFLAWAGWTEAYLLFAILTMFSAIAAGFVLLKTVSELSQYT